MNRSSAALLAGSVGALAAGVLLFGAPAAAKPTPTPTPTETPYSLGQVIIVNTKTQVYDPALTLSIPVSMVLTCPEGKVVTGGGFMSEWGGDPNNPTYNQDPSANSPVRQSFPSSPNSWTIRFGLDRQGEAEPVTGYAVCVNG